MPSKRHRANSPGRTASAKLPDSNPRAHEDGPRIPAAPRSIQAGSNLAMLLDREAVECLVHNLRRVYRRFDGESFAASAMEGLGPLGILDRGLHLAGAMRRHLPARYSEAIGILVDSLGPPLSDTTDLGLAPFFYLPHVSFVATYGLEPSENGGKDPFEDSMKAQHALTRRFSAEFSMRPFLDRHPERTLRRLMEWTRDPDPHVRRLCSEGARPRLPWAMRLKGFMADPTPLLPILEALKDDPELYVRRSVANHVGDIAKDHPALAFELCERWLEGATDARRWVIRHALRHPAGKGDPTALQLRKRAAPQGRV